MDDLQRPQQAGKVHAIHRLDQAVVHLGDAATHHIVDVLRACIQQRQIAQLVALAQRVGGMVQLV